MGIQTSKSDRNCDRSSRQKRSLEKVRRQSASMSNFLASAQYAIKDITIVKWTNALIQNRAFMTIPCLFPRFLTSAQILQNTVPHLFRRDQLCRRAKWTFPMNGLLCFLDIFFFHVQACVVVPPGTIVAAYLLETKVVYFSWQTGGTNFCALVLF